MHHAIEDALRLGFNTVQVFVKNQRQWRATPFDPADVERWHELCATPNFAPPIAHATYLINLGTPNPDLYEKSRAAFAEELERCQTLAIPGLVIHPGSAVGTTPEEAIGRIAGALNRIFDESPALTTMPLLETTAGQGASIGRTFEELGEILRQIREPQRVGICIDTCHVFAAGYDIRRADEYQRMIALAEKHVGLQRIRCWHLNDSKGDCGSRLDRHDHIGVGKIGPEGFRLVLADARFRDTPMILETPKETNENGEEWDTVNLATLRRLAAG